MAQTKETTLEERMYNNASEKDSTSEKDSADNYFLFRGRTFTIHLLFFFMNHLNIYCNPLNIYRNVHHNFIS